jgi:hypothetical protein
VVPGSREYRRRLSLTILFSVVASGLRPQRACQPASGERAILQRAKGFMGMAAWCRPGWPGSEPWPSRREAAKRVLTSAAARCAVHCAFSPRKGRYFGVVICVIVLYRTFSNASRAVSRENRRSGGTRFRRYISSARTSCVTPTGPFWPSDSGSRLPCGLSRYSGTSRRLSVTTTPLRFGSTLTGDSHVSGTPSMPNRSVSERP